MSGKNPIDDLFDQIGDLLKLVEKNSRTPVNPEKIPEDIEIRLAKLEKDVEAFKKLGDQIEELSGVSSVEMQKRLEGAAELPPEGVKLIEKGFKLKKKAEELDRVLKTGEAVIPEPSKLPEDPQYGKHRKKKFKRFGSDSKWKPL